MKETRTWEFGDYQTPSALAEQAVKYLRQVDAEFSPCAIIEPTCGVGRFLLAAADAFPNANQLLGVEIERDYLTELRNAVDSRADAKRFTLRQQNFFETDWNLILAGLSDPFLVVGNPPWVTSSDVGKLCGSNLPQKMNFKKYIGLDAITGKSNFDISEWMLMKHLNLLAGRRGYIAMLCKTSVARKVLRQLWQYRKTHVESRMVQIDAMKHFGATVDACFFIIKIPSQTIDSTCQFFPNFTTTTPKQIFGFQEGVLVSDLPAFRKNRDILGIDSNYVWRSGVKHDCAKVMELRRNGSRLVNGFGEETDLEEEFLYPLLKSSDVGNARVVNARFRMLVPQRQIGEDTGVIQKRAPGTWAYLLKHAETLDRRGSSVYRNKPRFSVFGVGNYTFSDWKVAISGFYKRLTFNVVGPIDGKPVVFDDTIYFLSVDTREEAEFLAGLFNSRTAQTFLEAMIFWTDKRPITTELLKRVHVGKLAEKLVRTDFYRGPQQNLLAKTP